MSKIKIQLSTDEMMLYQVMRHGCISVKMSRSGELVIEPEEPPEYMTRKPIRKINVQEALKRLLEARLWYCWENNQLFLLELPKVHILPLEIRAEKFNKRGTLIVSVDGEEVTGYTEIAKRVYGGYQKYLLTKLTEPLRSTFDINEIVFVKTKKVKGKEVAVYRWRGYDFTGFEMLKKKMFWLSEEDLKKLKKLAAENKMSIGEHRADQLIRLFDLSYEDGKYVMTDPSDQRHEVEFKYKKQVLEYIRQHEAGGTVSREVSRQMFETIGGEVKWQ